MNSEIEQLREEIFCTQLESRIFAAYVNYGKLERWMPGFSDPTTEDSHIKRYQFATQFTTQKKVLDMASGCGKGSHYIATEGKALSVDGIDLDPEAIRYATHRFPASNLNFNVGDATAFVKENKYEVIISFETIEHLPQIKTYLQNINRSLSQDGIFLVSTPISAVELDAAPKNPYHVQEWGFERFQAEVAEYLTIKTIYVQLYPLQNTSLLFRIASKLKSVMGIPRLAVSKFSTISAYEKQSKNYFESEFGKRQKGYQILVCTKK
ncbi:MAG: class I SAM-dependent methyltransferase [Bacteroidetes bacterium]|nr:class I SAM-dependent methyltransferase [Bacteroidota bacterium]